MKVVITGGIGMIGRKLIDSLLATPELINRDGEKAEITAITAFDVVAPNPPLPDDPRVSVVTGEVSDAATIEALIDEDTDTIGSTITAIGPSYKVPGCLSSSCAGEE